MSAVSVSTETVAGQRLADGWRTRRIWVAGAFGATLAGMTQILDFWSIYAGGSVVRELRGLFDLSRTLLLLPLAGLFAGLLVAAAIALWRRHFRRMASSVFAIAAIPLCAAVVVRVPLLDPWVWYVIANETKLEPLAASGRPPNGPDYAIVEGRDVSTGVCCSNHFTFIIYDSSDAIGLEPSDRPSIWRTRTLWADNGAMPPVPRGKRLHGHLFKVDHFF